MRVRGKDSIVVEYLADTGSDYSQVPKRKKAIIDVIVSSDGKPRFVMQIKKGKIEKDKLCDLLGKITLFKYLHPDRPKDEVLSSRHHHHHHHYWNGRIDHHRYQGSTYQAKRRVRNADCSRKRNMAWGVGKI